MRTSAQQETRRRYRQSTAGRAVERAYNLRRDFGISTVEWDKMFKSQGGACAVCKRVRPLKTDHDHVSGRVRGLLCHNCNIALGHLNDSPALCAEAAAYLLRTADGSPVSHDNDSEARR